VPGLDHVRGVGGVSLELEDEVGLDRSAHLGRAARVEGPTAPGQLLTAQVLGGFDRTRLVGPAQEMEEEEVLGLEDGVAFELAAPVAVRPLLSEQVLAGSLDGGVDGRNGILRPVGCCPGRLDDVGDPLS